ncbi:MAG: hypothetical protein B7Z66_12085 [Chromatiales bacterium 21-64-14]|nr:MAG: hypothetical protein B7Z66_12085 [Chromatiales bacterium 21-64-14]
MFHRYHRPHLEDADPFTRFCARFSPWLIPVDDLGVRFDLLQQRNARYGAANAITIAALLITSHFAPLILRPLLALLLFPPAMFLGFSAHCLVRELIGLPPDPGDPG